MALFGVLILAMVLYSGLSQLSRIRLDEATLRWNARFGDWEQLVGRHPSRDPSESALNMEQLAARLGADLTPRSRETGDRPAEGLAGEFITAANELGDYLDDQLRSPVAALEPPPEDAARFLRAHESTLAALRDALQVGEPPRWEQRVDTLFVQPIPNLIGHVKLNKMLLADALRLTHLGRLDEAEASVVASWNLSESLRGDPTLVTQLVAMGITRLQLGALRKLESASPNWDAELRGHDFRAAILEALQYEIAIHSSDNLRDTMMQGASQPVRWFTKLVDP